MKPITINFLPRQPMRPLLLWASALALFGLAAQQAGVAWRVGRDADLAETTRQLLSTESAAAANARHDAEAAALLRLPYADDVDALQREAAFPRDEAMAAIESARLVGARVTALDLSATEGSVKAELEFTDHATLLRYVDALNAGEPRQRWFLVQAQTGAAGAPGTATLRSSWRRTEP